MERLLVPESCDVKIGAYFQPKEEFTEKKKINITKNPNIQFLIFHFKWNLKSNMDQLISVKITKSAFDNSKHKYI